MDFKLDKAHQLQQQLFRNFAETEIKPLAKDMDEAEAYDMELLAKIQKCGFLGIPYAREYGGAGLGLSLVWEIANLHGGLVWVAESSETGTTIAVELPIQQAAKP